MTANRSRLAHAYIPGYAGHTSGLQSAVTRIVIHGTVSLCELGGARGNASYFASAGSGGLAHYVCDPGEIVQCCDENVIAWHAPPNPGSIGVELCDPQTGSGARWADQNHQAMLALAARLVVDIAGRWNVPLTRIGPAQLLAGAHGICGHGDVSAAWHQSDHTDPGPDFPWAQFMALLGTAPAPTPTPVPTPAPAPEDDDMAYIARAHGDARWYACNLQTQTKRYIPDPAIANALTFAGDCKSQGGQPFVWAPEVVAWLTDTTPGVKPGPQPVKE